MSCTCLALSFSFDILVARCGGGVRVVFLVLVFVNPKLFILFYIFLYILHTCSTISAMMLMKVENPKNMKTPIK